MIQLNTDETPQLAARFGVRGIPALFAVRQGKVLGQTSGGMSKDAILGWFGQYLQSTGDKREE